MMKRTPLYLARKAARSAVAWLRLEAAATWLRLPAAAGFGLGCAALGWISLPVSSQPVPQPLDLYLLIGQSNMAGRGEVAPEDREIPPRVWTLNKDKKWVPAVDPIHFDKTAAGVGPGRTFGIKMARQFPSATIGLIPCAVGGTSIRKWQPGGWDEKTQTHPYDDMLQRLMVARERGTLKGILWHQGESDGKMGLGGTYEAALIQLIERLRTECDDPELPFVIGQLGLFAQRPWSEGRQAVDQAHRRVAEQVPRTGFVSSEGLTDRGDLVHFDAESARLLGQRFAEKLIELVKPPKGVNHD